jgi:ribose 5-phosphate isomerase B
VARSAARAHQVRGYNRLAMPGRQRVNRTQAERHDHADQDRGPTEFALVQQTRQVIGLRGAGLSGRCARRLRKQARGQKNRQRKVPFHYNSPYELYCVMKQVITAQDVPAGGDLRVVRGAIVTPSARELMAARGVRLLEVSQEEMPAPPPEHVLALGADHSGYRLKETLKPVLAGLGLAVRDVGVDAETPADYPDIAVQVAELIVSGVATRGILIDGAGIGSAMAANKVPGIRAALCYDKASARNSREHNDANVLTLGARLLTVSQAEDVLRTWIATPFAGGRHQARVQKIRDIEQRYFKKVEQSVPGGSL